MLFYCCFVMMRTCLCVRIDENAPLLYGDRVHMYLYEDDSLR